MSDTIIYTIEKVIAITGGLVWLIILFHAIEKLIDKLWDL